MINDKFTQTYLKSLKMVQQSVEDEECDCKDGNCPNCKKDGEEIEECDNTDSVPSDNSEEIIEDDVDEDLEDQEEVSLDQTDTQSDEENAADDEDTASEDGETPTCFCFKTINKDLIDAINSGFDKVVFTVKATDDDGNETTTDVEFSADAFEDFSECDVEEDQSADVCPECGNEPCTCDAEDDSADLDDEDGQGEDEDFEDDEDTSFESVFKRYYGSLVNENKKK